MRLVLLCYVIVVTADAYNAGRSKSRFPRQEASSLKKVGEFWLLNSRTIDTLNWFGYKPQDLHAISNLENNLSPELASQYHRINICKKLLLSAKQDEICHESDINMAAMLKAMLQSQTICTTTFVNERWNCSIYGRERAKFVKRGYRQVAFMQALTSASLAYGMAHLCSYRGVGDKHKQCKAIETGRGQLSDNMPAGNKFAKRVLQLARLKKQSTARNRIVLHNFQVGLQLLRQSVEREVSFTNETRAMINIDRLGEQLKSAYENARKKNPDVMLRRSGEYDTSDHTDYPELWYYEDEPNFCVRSDEWAGQERRQCGSYVYEKSVSARQRQAVVQQCERICCQRGYMWRSGSRHGLVEHRDRHCRKCAGSMCAVIEHEHCGYQEDFFCPPAIGSHYIAATLSRHSQRPSRFQVNTTYSYSYA